MFMVPPIIGLIGAYFALKKFGLSKEKVESIREELEERRGTV